MRSFLFLVSLLLHGELQNHEALVASHPLLSMLSPNEVYGISDQLLVEYYLQFMLEMIDEYDELLEKELPELREIFLKWLSDHVNKYVLLEMEHTVDHMPKNPTTNKKDPQRIRRAFRPH